MTMMRILQCVVLLCVLAMAGCGGNEIDPPTTSTNKNTTPTTRPNSNVNANTTASAQSSPSVKDKQGHDAGDKPVDKVTSENKGQQGVKLGANANKPSGQEGDSSATANSNASAQANDQTQKSSDQDQ